MPLFLTKKNKLKKETSVVKYVFKVYIQLSINIYLLSTKEDK